VPDDLSAGTVAHHCRTKFVASTVKAVHVVALVQGLSKVVPDLIGIDNEKIIVNANADGFKAALTAQLESLHSNSPD